MSSRIGGRLRRGSSDTADSTDHRQDTVPIEVEDVASLEGDLGERPSRHRRARIAALAAVLLVAVAIALVVILSSSSKKTVKQGNGVPAGDTRTTVQRRSLAEHASIDGTLTYGSKLELYDRISGTFTWLPSVGSVIGRGGTLFEVNELPIVLMYGSVPAYRALKEGVSNGADVKELNENLVVLGYDPYGEITDYEHFGAATAAAVKRWQAAKGLPQTGEVELGRVVFAPSARRITEVHVGLGQDPPGGSSSEDPEEGKEPAGEGKEPTGDTEEPAGGKEPTSDKKPTGDKEPSTGSKEPAEKEKEPKTKEPAAKEPSGKAKEPTGQSKEPSGKAPAKEAADDPDSGDSPSKGSEEPSDSGEKPSDESEDANAGMLTLTTTSTQQLVQLEVEAAQQQLAHVGETVPVTLPSGNRVKGRITSVGTVATESSSDGETSGGGGKATISVTIALERPVRRLDEAPVTAELVKESVKNVLTVPATALIATGGGHYAIETLQDGRRTQLEVTTGMFADGYVQIEGPGVHEGLTVTEPSE